jgi:uncharacterized protein YhaN
MRQAGVASPLVKEPSAKLAAANIQINELKATVARYQRRAEEASDRRQEEAALVAELERQRLELEAACEALEQRTAQQGLVGAAPLAPPVAAAAPDDGAALAAARAVIVGLEASHAGSIAALEAELAQATATMEQLRADTDAMAAAAAAAAAARRTPPSSPAANGASAAVADQVDVGSTAEAVAELRAQLAVAEAELALQSKAAVQTRADIEAAEVELAKMAAENTELVQVKDAAFASMVQVKDAEFASMVQAKDAEFALMVQAKDAELAAAVEVVRGDGASVPAPAPSDSAATSATSTSATTSGNGSGGELHFG